MVYMLQGILPTKKGPAEADPLFRPKKLLLTYTMFDDRRLEIVTSELDLIHAR